VDTGSRAGGEDANMPTYDYECTNCGYTFEQFQKMSDQPLSECPSCGGRVRRLIGGGLGVIFKGSGFYVTDNKSAKQAAGTASSASKESGTEPPKSETSESSGKPGKKKEEPVKT